MTQQQTEQKPQLSIDGHVSNNGKVDMHSDYPQLSQQWGEFLSLLRKPGFTIEFEPGEVITVELVSSEYPDLPCIVNPGDYGKVCNGSTHLLMLTPFLAMLLFSLFFLI